MQLGGEVQVGCDRQMQRWWTIVAQGSIVSGLYSMVFDRAGMQVEIALMRHGNTGAGNINWVVGRRP